VEKVIGQHGRQPEGFYGNTAGLSSIAFLSQNIRVIPLDGGTWRLFSEIKAAALSSGKVTGDFDILIAATAKRHGLAVVTNNISHYESLPIPVENWVHS